MILKDIAYSGAASGSGVTTELMDSITEDPTVFYNISEPHSLYPYRDTGGYHYNDERAILNSLFTRFDDSYNITFISSDIYIDKNSKLVLDALNKKSSINIISFPWFFLSEYYITSKTPYLTLKDDISIPIKRHAICLTGVSKMSRNYILTELSSYENLLYSSMLFDKQKEIEYIVHDIELRDDDFQVIGIEAESKEPFTFVMSPDERSEQFLFQYNSNRYFKPDPSIFKHYSGHHETSTRGITVDKQVPIEFLESAVYIGCETQTVDACIMTEKTIKAFFYEKPFLVHSVKGYYEWLTSNGFVLYDELFNYSFDKEEDMKRIKMFVDECKRILDMKLTDLIHIISTLKDKLKHNNDLCRKINNKIYGNGTKIESILNYSLEKR